MAHLSQQIMDAIKTALTGLATTGANVYDGMPEVLDDAQLPALVLEDGEDRAEHITRLYPRMVYHTTQFRIRCMVKQSAPANVLRTVRNEVEKALTAVAPNLSGLTRDIKATGVFSRQFDYENEVPTASIVLTYDVEWQHLETAPDLAS